MEIKEMEKGICINCKELRYLDDNNLCIYCSRGTTMIGKEIKNIGYLNTHGKEIKSKSGSIKPGFVDNAWMSNS